MEMIQTRQNGVLLLFSNLLGLLLFSDVMTKLKISEDLKVHFFIFKKKKNLAKVVHQTLNVHFQIINELKKQQKWVKSAKNRKGKIQLSVLPQPFCLEHY